MWEDKETIVKKLSICLKSCRAGADLKTLEYDKEKEIVRCIFDGGEKTVNVACDSGVALISDVIKVFM